MDAEQIPGSSVQPHRSWIRVSLCARASCGKLERGFWLGDVAFYERRLATNATMVLPTPGGIMDRTSTIAAMREAARWQSVELSDTQLMRFAADKAVLIYSVQADRGDASNRYKALCSSIYTDTIEGWQLLLHQQTPIV
jgi:hypothetical protein